MLVFEVSIHTFPSSPSFGSKLKSDQNKINLLVAASKVSCYVILDQLSPCFHVFLSPPNTYLQYSFIHSLTLYFISFSQPFLLYHLMHYLLITWNLFVTVVIQRGTAHPITFILLPQVAWFITPHIESDQKPIEFQSNICISASSVWFNCQCCQSCLCCYLPEPCHSSMPCNLVSRFTV